jgi:hypothetical protein
MLRVPPYLSFCDGGRVVSEQDISERTIMENVALLEELASAGELEELYELDASESDPEDDEDDDDDDDDDDDEEPDVVPHG